MNGEAWKVQCEIGIGQQGLRMDAAVTCLATCPVEVLHCLFENRKPCLLSRQGLRLIHMRLPYSVETALGFGLCGQEAKTMRWFGSKDRKRLFLESDIVRNACLSSAYDAKRLKLQASRYRHWVIAEEPRAKMTRGF
jgi:hypothetical protein